MPLGVVVRFDFRRRLTSTRKANRSRDCNSTIRDTDAHDCSNEEWTTATPHGSQHQPTSMAQRDTRHDLEVSETRERSRNEEDPLAQYRRKGSLSQR